MTCCDSELGLPSDRPLTVDDLARIPDGLKRYELSEGRLEPMALPRGTHSRGLGRLLYHVTTHAPEWAEALVRADVVLNHTGTSYRIADMLVLRTADFGTDFRVRPPLVVLEMLSPESVFHDTHAKKNEYAAFGVENYWIVNPSLDKTGILVLRLENGTYREVAQAFGGDVLTVDPPFPVRIVPEWLVADGPWRSKIGGPDSDDEHTAEERPDDGSADATTGGATQ